MILEIETATNILDALDGVDILSNATIRTAKAAGAERLHSMFRERMIADGWSRGAKHYTDRESKTTPHVDEWTTFTAETPAKYTLRDESTNATIEVGLATPSGRRRVKFYELEATRPSNEMQRRIYETMIAEAQSARENGETIETIASKGMDEIITRAMLDGRFSVDEVLNARRPNAEEKNKNLLVTIAQFRVAADVSQLPTGWTERFGDDAFLLDQNVVEMEGFVNSFRHSID